MVAKLRAAGAVIIGKTVTTEFAFYHPGPTRNPHDTSRTPGGSSSGSAAAVAAGMVPLALGSQTNGSIIRPAAFCGVFGVKPSHGLVSRAGVLPLSRKLDHVGAFARSLPDLALILDVIAGYDPADPDTRPVAAPDFRALQAERSPLTPRFAFVRTPIWDKADADTKAAFEELAEALGAAVRAGRSARTGMPKPGTSHRTIMAADMAHNLAPLTEARRAEPGDARVPRPRPQRERGRLPRCAGARRRASPRASPTSSTSTTRSSRPPTAGRRAQRPRCHRRSGLLHACGR